MNKTKSINRLFLAMILWALLCPYFIGGFLRSFSLAMQNIVGELILAIPVIVYVIVKRIHVQEWIPFRKINLPVIGMSALLGFLLLPLITFINICSLFFSTNYVSETGIQMASNPLWLNLLSIAVVPAVVEELIFRGIIYHGHRVKGVLMATLANGLVFGIMHRNLNQFCYTFILGLIFCMVLEITGSIFSSITMHFVINGWNVLLIAVQQPLLEMAGAGAQEAQSALTTEVLIASMGIYGMVALFATALAIGVMIWMTKYCKREAHMRWCFKKHPLPEGEKRSFVTPAFVITVIITFIYMILLEVQM